MVKHTVVLGAGPAGLSAALGLAREGVEVDVLEMDSQVGGLCKSTKKDGFIFDLGGHRFITKDELVLAEIEGLMKDDLLLRPRKSVIRLQGRFFNYPVEILDVLLKINPVVSLRCASDFLATKLGAYSGLNDNSFENWVIKRFGRTLYDIYFGPYSHKLWGVPPTQISSDWAAQRISLVNIMDVFLRALGRKKDPPKTYALNFLYPRCGIGQISERMAEEIKKRQGRIHLKAKVKKIILENNRIKKVVYEQDNAEKDISADFVVSTIPLPEFILSIEPKVAKECSDVAQDMRFRSIKFIHLLLNIEHVSDNTWIYSPEEKYFFFRIQDRRNWSPTTVADGKNALTLEISCNKGDAIWNASDEEIFEKCIKDLEELRLISRKDVTGYFTETAQHSYPIYSLDYKQRTRMMVDFLSGIKDFISKPVRIEELKRLFAKYFRN